MALTKISELTAAGALDGTEMIPVVQSSTTKRATPAQIRTYIAALIAANNLSDLASASTARTNLGLGSIATQAASSVAITGGSITGITDLALADGGTGASTAADARTNLGLVAGGAGDIWVEKAGDTMTGTLEINLGASNSTYQFVNGGQQFDTFLNFCTVTNYANNALSAAAIFQKSRSATKFTHSIVSNNDVIFSFTGRGSDGSAYRDAAQITFEIDGTPGASDMPGRIVFRTTADGAASTSEAGRFDQAKNFQMGGANTVIDSNRLHRFRAYTVATLPAAGTAGRKAYVTDALAPTYLATLVGGGAVVTEAFDNGTNWIGT